MTDIIDIAWLGGLLEGEGYFGLEKGKYAIITLLMCDEDTVVKAAVIMGAKVNHRKNYWKTNVYGADAIKWMMILLPFLGKRRRNVIAGIIKYRKEHSYRAPNGTRTMATCHPDRIVHSFGLCNACYSRRWKEKQLLKKVG